MCLVKHVFQIEDIYIYLNIKPTSTKNAFHKTIQTTTNKITTIPNTLKKSYSLINKACMKDLYTKTSNKMLSTLVK
jgi:hypothetical protein